MAETRVEHTGLAPSEKFAKFCTTVVGVLPWGLCRVIPANFLGFVLINGFTFGVDLALLTALHGWLDWSVPVSVTGAYACAFGLSFVLNRWLNFRSHAAVGPQVWWYVLAVVLNYLAFILGVGSGLAALGMEYHVARIIAGACEGIFMYSALRWVVFADRSRRST